MAISALIVAQLTARAGLRACLESVSHLADQIVVFDQGAHFEEEIRSSDLEVSYFPCPYATIEVHSEKDAFHAVSGDLILYMLGTDCLPAAGRAFVRAVAEEEIYPHCHAFFAGTQDVSPHAHKAYEDVRRTFRPFLMRAGAAKPAELPMYFRETYQFPCYVKGTYSGPGQPPSSMTGWQLEDRTNDRDLLEHYRIIQPRMMGMGVDLSPNIAGLEEGT